MGKIQDISKEEQAEMVDVNCRSVVEISSLLLPYMKYRGRMIYMASAAAFLPQPGFAVYAASKAFVLSYVRALRAENRERQLRVTAVCPGAVKTEFFNRALTKKHFCIWKGNQTYASCDKDTAAQPFPAIYRKEIKRR